MIDKPRFGAFPLVENRDHVRPYAIKLRPYVTGVAWHPQVSFAWPGEGRRRVEPDLPDLQSSEDLAPASQRGHRLRGPVRAEIEVEATRASTQR